MQDIRIASIGTSMIVGDFVDAVGRCEGIVYAGAYSRRMETARAFADEHGAALAYDSLAELAADPCVDAVYVASPNGLHYAQALELARAGKHLLVEKPFCANEAQAARLLAEAREHGCVAMEAIRPVHDPAILAIRDALPSLGAIRRASLRFGKYSSRYDELLAGRQTNVFDARMASGALMDIGIYPIEVLVTLFGAPDNVLSVAVPTPEATREQTGGTLDGAGTLLATYRDAAGRVERIVEADWSKVTTDQLPSQVEGEAGTLVVDGIEEPHSGRITYRGAAVRNSAVRTAASVGDQVVELPIEPVPNGMIHELRDFVSCVRLWSTDRAAAEAKLAPWHAITLQSLHLTDAIRATNGISFPADIQ